MTTTELYPSGTAPSLPVPDRVASAAADLGEIRAQAKRIRSREGQSAIKWICGELEGALVTYARLTDPEGDMDPYDVLAPEMGWWDDPQAQAEEYAADQARQIALAARKRLAEYKGREYAALVRAREWMAL